MMLFFAVKGPVVTDIRLEHTLRRIPATKTTFLPTTHKPPVTYNIGKYLAHKPIKLATALAGK